MRRNAAILLALLPCAVFAEDGVEFNGHTKLRLIDTTYPSQSIFRELAGSNSPEAGGDLRLNVSASRERWQFDAAYQLIGLYGDRIEYTRNLPPFAEQFSRRLPSDDRRLFDLTKVLHDQGKSAWLQRLDRLWVGYANEKVVARFGRQAISWGNGLFYAPMDLVNPFDPAAVDTEYKSGDDMLYLQYLQGNGNDVQAATVIRRDVLTGDVEADQATIAAKYHGFAGDNEYDLLVAGNYGDTVLGIGGSRNVGGAILRGDVVVTNTDDDTYVQVVANWTWSWTWHGRNMSGAVEYYFDGFGQPAGEYDPASLAGNPDLLQRIVRGDSYTLGRHYLATSVLVEMSPLWSLTPTVLASIGDPSALLQVNTRRSLSDNLTFLGSVSLPIGPDGSEFGGIVSGQPGLYLATGPALFAQLAWYF